LYEIRCKRCNRILTSEESIKRGYGPTCYRIMQFQKQESENDLYMEIQFLKYEINFLKRQLRELRTHKALASSNNVIPIKRMKQTPNLNINEFRSNFINVVNELKGLFNQGDSFDYHKYLKKISDPDPFEKSTLKNIQII